MNKKYILGLAVAAAFAAVSSPAFAKTASVKIISPAGGSIGQVGSAQTVRWSTSDYPKGAGVNINLLRKVSSNPDRYEFIRVIKENTPDDGVETWTPSASDTGDNLVVQVSCSGKTVFPEGCSSVQGTSRIAILDSAERQSYLASVIEAIKQSIAEIAASISALKRK
ncbi:MAG: GPI anchored serine-threonine rich family protein [Candidatus Pacebacteria bacterium]|nr:GPI anchored serine-threonine rich family protein [Candidatus Paceibacterota bacterium]